MTKEIAEVIIDKRTLNKGRPLKLTARDRRNILRQVEVLRSQGQYNFTIKRVKMLTGLSGRVSDESVRLVLHRDRLYKRCAAKKGVLTGKNARKNQKENIYQKENFLKLVTFHQICRFALTYVLVQGARLYRKH